MCFICDVYGSLSHLRGIRKWHNQIVRKFSDSRKGQLQRSAIPISAALFVEGLSCHQPPLWRTENVKGADCQRISETEFLGQEAFKPSVFEVVIGHRLRWDAWGLLQSPKRVIVGRYLTIDFYRCDESNRFKTGHIWSIYPLKSIIEHSKALRSW